MLRRQQNPAGARLSPSSLENLNAWKRSCRRLCGSGVPQGGYGRDGESAAESYAVQVCALATCVSEYQLSGCACLVSLWCEVVVNWLQEESSRKFLVAQVAPKLAMKKASVEVVIVRAASGASEAIGTAICKYAEDIHAVTLVMMRNAKPWLKEIFVGSVTNQCMHKSTVPLTIIQ